MNVPDRAGDPRRKVIFRSVSKGSDADVMKNLEDMGELHNRAIEEQKTEKDLNTLTTKPGQIGDIAMDYHTKSGRLGGSLGHHMTVAQATNLYSGTDTGLPVSGAALSRAPKKR